MRSRIHPAYKTKYGVANWASYDRALVRRGDVTLWLSPEAITTWEPARVGTRGAQPKYSHLAIETALTLRLLFHLPLRQTEGFLTSIFGISSWTVRDSRLSVKGSGPRRNTEDRASGAGKACLRECLTHCRRCDLVELQTSPTANPVP
jgi:Transposase DDE domain